MLQDCVRVLSDPRLGRGNAELSERLAWRLLPFLVLTGAKPDSPQLQLATCVATCPILAQQPLTQSWAKGSCRRLGYSLEHAMENTDLVFLIL